MAKLIIVVHSQEALPFLRFCSAFEDLRTLDKESAHIAFQKELIGEFIPKQEGEYVINLVLNPKFIEIEAAKFNEYLQHDGLPQILELRKQSGQLDRPGKERYSRCVKSVLQVGAKKDRLLGDKLPIQLLFRGQPLRQHWIAASYEGFAGEGFAQSVQTDEQGKASFSLDRAGRWVVRTIQMIPALEKDPQTEWESFWGTVTVSVDDARGR